MTFFEKYVRLRQTPPFDGLPANVVAALAEACEDFSFARGERAVAKGGFPSVVFVVTDGALCTARGRLPRVFDAGAALLNREYADDVYADAENGARGLALTRAQFCAAARGCPALLVALTRLGVAKTEDAL